MKKAIKISLLVLGILGIVFFGIVLVQNGATQASYKRIMNEPQLTFEFSDQQNNETLSLSFEKGTSYAQVIKGQGIFHYVVVPLMAIWLEDQEGNYIQTLYVSSKIFDIDRPTALPVWSHLSNMLASEGTDGISGASNSDVKEGLSISPDTDYNLVLEINRSYDYNDFYQEGLQPGQAGYNADFSGQPSLIYRVRLADLQKDKNQSIEVLGHGTADGTDGEIHFDMEQITTAYDLISNLQMTRR